MTQEPDKCPHEELKEIFRQALRAKSKTKRKRLRNEGLRKMVAAPEKCFWGGRPPQYRQDLLYIEAANKAWDYIERKIHGNIRGKGTAEEKAYDPDQGDASPITLWNIRCENEYNDLHQQQQPFIRTNPIDPRTGEPLNIDSVPQPDAEEDTIPADELIAQARQMIEADAAGKYQNHYVRQDPPPPITIQAAMLFICDITARGTKWTLAKVARHFNIPPGVMNGRPRQLIKDFFREIGDRLRDRYGL